MRILLDMDDVLVDFLSGYQRECQQNGWPQPVVPQGEPCTIPAAHWKEFNYHFWRGLAWTQQGAWIVRMAEALFGRDNVYLCSSPIGPHGNTNEETCAGKLRWIETHLSEFYRDRLILTKHKHLMANRDTLLVDDFDHNVDAFRRAGGQAILVPKRHNRGWRDLDNLTERLTVELVRVHDSMRKAAKQT